MLDADLARLYGVTTKRLNEQVRRNADRFPEDFSFILTKVEFANLRSHFATSNELAPGRGGRRKPPTVFTEHGAIMAAAVLNCRRAVEVSVFVVRAFVQLRDDVNATISFNGLARATRSFAKSLARMLGPRGKTNSDRGRSLAAT